jgi:hypothetical protein
VTEAAIGDVAATGQRYDIDSPPRFNPKASAAIAEHVRLASIELLGTFFRRRDDGCLPEPSVVEPEFEFSIIGSWQLQQSGDPQLGVCMLFEAATDESEGMDGDVFVGAEFRAVYDLATNGALSKSDLEVFAYWNGLLTLWPYWREHLRTVTDRAGFRCPPVPVFRVPAT